MKYYFLILILIFSTSGNCHLNRRAPYSPQALDTVKIYNVYCSYTEGIIMTTWGGNYSSFFPAEECPSKNKELFIENYKIVAPYLSAHKFFWMKLYSSKDKLIYESLKYDDCRVGRFTCYWPNGKKKMTGEYDGSYIKKKTGEYVLKTCAGQKSGTWCYYDESGKFLRLEEF